MNYQINNQQELVIDFKAVLLRLLKQWKAVILLASVMAVVVSGLNYIKDTKNYELQIKAATEAQKQASLSKEEQIANIMAVLPEDAKATVNYIVNEQLWVDEQKAYLQNSILMQTDATNQRVLSLVYDITTEQNSLLPLLVDNYKVFISGEEAAKTIKEAIDPAVEEKYICELFLPEKTLSYDNELNRSAFEVNIILPESVDDNQVAEAITKALTMHEAEIDKKQPNSIVLVETAVSHFFNSDAIESRKNIFEGVNGMELHANNAKDALPDIQRNAVDSIVSIKQGTEINNTDSIQEEMIVAPRYSLKSAIIGFCGGALLYALVFAFWTVIRGRFNSATEVESYTGKRLIGEINYEDRGKRFSWWLTSDLINKHFNKDAYNTEKKIKKIAESLSAICKHGATEKITLLKTSRALSEGACEKIISEIVKASSCLGVSAQVLDAECNFDERQLVGVDNVVVLTCDDSKMMELGKVLVVCDDYDLQNYGNIYLERI